jgi:hypothetical protein
MADPDDISAHDLISLVAAATLLYYRITPRPSTLRDQAARDEIHRLSLALATMVPLYRVDLVGGFRALTAGELDALTLLIESQHILDHSASPGADLAIRTVDLKSATEAVLKEAGKDAPAKT